MRSLLNLAGVGSSGTAWRVIETDGGDVTVIDVDCEAGESRWHELASDGADVVALSARSDFSAEFVLRKPLRPREFLDLLENWVARRRSVLEEVLPEPPAEVVLESEPVKWLGMETPNDPDRATLAEHLRRRTWREPVILQAEGWPRLVIDPGSGSWYYEGSMADMAPERLAESLPASAGRPVSSRELAERSAHVGRRRLSELKWFAGLGQSRGRLHPDLLGPVQFMLTQAPAEAMANERFAGLARILIRAPLGLEELHARSGEAQESIAAFLNACYTTGRLLVNRSARAAGF
ncbi:hypothetical protein G4Y73_07880 [Wenzhouxiangella sp. XN201]|uniref:hypothetical protein n=1 Tax=Wenzhouxiangella sp. XN201 TaxID=2710755 RepID=UPI0013C9D8EA|nr:hypothetical protein [Wenzhouxiangella sp. XN201]NEZ04071.1 hypothetical protein [Wenzhouxiangella sp. XN201]